MHVSQSTRRKENQWTYGAVRAREKGKVPHNSVISMFEIYTDS
jgi:hypothetical protein